MIKDGYPVVEKWKAEPGARAGALTLIKFDHKTLDGHKWWLCKCDCGNEVIKRQDNLSAGARGKKGGTRSCGCKRENMGIFNNGESAAKGLHKSKYEEQGTTYSKAKILEKLPYIDNNRSTVLRCECPKCHDWFFTTSRATVIPSCPHDHDLTKFLLNRKCRSLGEEKIRKLLMKANVPFIQEHKFIDCADKLPLPFDFYLESPNYGKYVIEFDGEQHFKPTDCFGGKEKFTYQRKHDKIKNQYCWEHNIKMIRIPFNKYEQFELNDLSVATSKFLFTPDKEEQYYKENI